MRASTDPAGMTDDELVTNERHHQAMGDSYQRLAAKDDSPERAKAYRDLAARHQSTADACRKEAKRRKRGATA
jgi:hypothetical protein